jgi:hypothetical protein
VELGAPAMMSLGAVSRRDVRRGIKMVQSAFTLRGNPVAPGTLADVAGEVRLDVLCACL